MTLAELAFPVSLVNHVKALMTSTSIYHYVYRITNLVENKHYYGSRTSKVHPSLDLGVKYFSSSWDKDFIKEQKTSPRNFRYKVVRILPTREEAMTLEISLHNKFDVGVNKIFTTAPEQLRLVFVCQV